ncbi:MAG: hypothetical protein ABI643_02565 [Candidatus Doudnabacteria bacterium]
MSFLSDYFHYLVDIVLISGYGWTVFLVFLVWMLWWLKRDANRIKYANSIEWVLLEVKIDELNEKSPLAMEQIFAALHAIHTNYSWGEQLSGKTVLSVSCEIVSLGGKVSYIFRIPTRFRNLLESAVFAQYAKAEIREIEDYLRNLPHHYDPEHADFEFWGTEWLKKKDNAYPIRTYLQDSSYEHGAQETFIDPLSNVIEVMSNIQPYELLLFQLVIKPIDDSWKNHTKHLVEKLKGVPEKHGDDWLLKIVHFVPDLIAKILVGIVAGPAEEHAPASRVQEEPPSLMLHKTDNEKLAINAIEHAASKIGYEVRIRTFYLAPKGKINKSLRIPEIVGAFRNFDDVNLNGMKPDIGHSWTEGPSFHISERLERPYIENQKLKRRRHILHWILTRSSWQGVGKVIMNTEELASIFHFPQVPHTRISQLERVQTVKSAPPMDLPIR